ncbi:MAG: YkvA family protein [Peptoniphilaceae bacterium]
MNPLKILSSLRKVSEAVYKDKNRFFKLAKDVKHKSVNIEEFNIIEHEIKLMVNLSKDYIRGNYKKVSKTSMLTIIASFIYLLNPMDVVPDFLLGIGFLDDLTVLTYAISKIKKELDKYENWKNLNEIK